MGKKLLFLRIIFHKEMDKYRISNKNLLTLKGTNRGKQCKRNLIWLPILKLHWLAYNSNKNIIL